MQERLNALPDIDYFIRFSEYKSVNGLNLPHLVVRSIGDQINEEFAISKYKDFKGFGQARSGHILLQDHGNTVFFRNVKVKGAALPNT